MNNIIKTSFCITFCLSKASKYVAWGLFPLWRFLPMDAPASSDEDESTQITTFLLQAYKMHDKIVTSSADLISFGNEK